MGAAWNVGDKFKVQTQDSGGSNHFCRVGPVCLSRELALVWPLNEPIHKSESYFFAK